MRELERDSSFEAPAARHIVVVGAGRLGSALAEALCAAGYAVEGPLARGELPGGDAVPVLLCVPDREIGVVDAHIARHVMVGHCSGASGLGVLNRPEAFSLHPLMTVSEDGASFTGAGAAVAGTTAGALATARELAGAVGMVPVVLAEEDRAVYHAAASMASNFLITLEAAAERLAADAGLERRLLVPLVRATVENWAALGPERALTGPVARGDEETVAAQRRAVAQRAPELVDLFDALVAGTRSLAEGAKAAA